MTARDVLITRVHDATGLPLFASPGAMGEPVELWVVTAEGHEPLTVHAFTEALDMALTWVGELGGQIYRRNRPGDEAVLYNAAW